MDWSIIIGIVGILIAVIIFRLQRNRRRVSYQIISNALVVSISQEVKGKVQVQFEGRPVEDAHLVIIKLWNSGDEFIRAEDYATPIKFNFGKAEILGIPEILETEPNGLKDRVSLSCDPLKENVILEPLLLNKNDSIKWTVMLTGFTGLIKVEGRIAGVKEIKRLDVSLTYPSSYGRLILDAVVSEATRRR